MVKVYTSIWLYKYLLIAKAFKGKEYIQMESRVLSSRFKKQENFAKDNVFHVINSHISICVIYGNRNIYYLEEVELEN